MKKSLFYLFAILFMAGTVTACSSSDDDKDVVSVDIVGEWKLDGAFNGDTVEKSPIELTIVRKAGVEDKDFSIMGFIPGEKAMEMGSGIAGGLVMKVLEEIIFLDDSNIIAKYKEMDGTKPTGEWITSPEGLASYKLLTNNSLLLKLDADAIIKEANIENEKIVSIVKEFLKDDFILACSFNDEVNKLKFSMDLLDITNKNINRAFEEILALPDEVLDGMGGKEFLEALSKELAVMFSNASKFEASILLKR